MEAGVMITAPASGSGKTLLACGLMSALKQMGKEVRACKCGPDYIDPMFHRKVLGVDSENLDLFFSGKEGLRQNYALHSAGADITIVEGVMGYYDGSSFGALDGSAYDVARTLELPVIMVVPCRGMAVSVLPLIRGFLEYREDSNIRGIVLNRISPMLYPRMKAMIEKELREKGFDQISVVGYLPEEDVFRLESRHLGLVMPDELTDMQERIGQIGRRISETIELETILELASAGRKQTDSERISSGQSMVTDKKTVKIAVARDKAFCFYYKDNLKLLEDLGCELEYFSPLTSKKIPEGCSGLILGGGYPELYAKELEQNEEIRKEIKNKLKKGMPCLAECGGFQYLQTELLDPNHQAYAMTGVIDSSSENKGRLVRFGYVTVETEEDTPYLKPGEKIRGHEFHHWDSTNNGKSCTAIKPDGKRAWKCIYTEQNLFAGYPHLYYPSCPKFARRFVEACRNYA